MPAHGRGGERRFRRAAGVAAREVGGEFFLVAPGDRTIHQLDPMASAVWRALSKARSVGELIDLFEAVFPKTPKRRIARDIEKLIAFLELKGLVVATTRT
jgi:Coenzyme PQQ synthesis protein D (PqqD)